MLPEPGGCRVPGLQGPKAMAVSRRAASLQVGRSTRSCRSFQPQGAARRCTRRFYRCDNRRSCARKEDWTSSKLANHFVERYDLIPPVNVRALLDAVADVEEVEWRFEVDGLVLGLCEPGRARVFLKSNQPPNRMRFTIAHEWGHILIPWHVESLLWCHVEVATMPTLENREREANEFAARMLVPDRFIRATIATSKDPNFWLSEGLG